ncbi:MAG: hypothetical protein LBL06_02290 [Treponema sp.]|jgi:hypothetical protein|nr:hypothetical protein [Treponema sp.]
MKFVLASITILCSLSFAAILLFTGLKTAPKEGGYEYAVLSFDASLNDREIGERLAKSEIGRNYISESTQTVFLNDFDRIKEIPLDEFQGKIENFDPRNDGYAGRMSAFFIREDRRLFFVPLLPETSKRETIVIQADFASVLQDIPFTIEFLGYEKSAWLYVAVFCVAALTALLLTKPLWIGFLLLPLTAGFAFTGIPGLAMTTFLLAAGGITYEPLKEFFFACLCEKNIRKVREWFRFPRLKNMKLFQRFPFRTALFILFIMGYFFIGKRSEIATVLMTGTFCCFFMIVLLIAIVRAENMRRGRFMPIPIIRITRKEPLFAKNTLPFSIAAVVILFLPGVLDIQSDPNVGEWGDPTGLIDESEYQKHIAFQSGFSTMRLNSNGKTDYEEYYLGDDGLIAGTRPYDKEKLPEFIPKEFSLKKLMNFLEKPEHNGVQAGGALVSGASNFNIPTFGSEEFVLLALLVPLCVSALLGFFPKRQGSKKKKMFIYDEKRKLFRRRIAA